MSNSNIEILEYEGLTDGEFERYIVTFAIKGVLPCS